MALGFQNCCDIEDYFYVNGIPGSVSEYEIYYIETTQGETLCGTYVELPELFYQPVTYDLIGMTAQTSCANCILLNPCPTGITINFGQQHTGIYTTVNECTVKTIFPFYVECVTVFPTLDNSTTGSVSLYVTGGTPPYSFYSAGTETQIGQGIEPTSNIYLLYNDVNSGTYSTIVTDYYGDNVQTIDCMIPQLPDYIYAECLITNPTYNGYSDGSLSLYVTGGTLPYRYYYNGNEITLPLTNLSADTYNITVIDSGIGIYSQTATTSCLIENPAEIVYPNKLCMNFDYCGVEFYLNFTSASTYNFRPLYTLDNPSEISVTGMSLYWNVNWLTSIENHNAPLAIPTQCQQEQTCSFVIQNPFAIKPQDSGWNGSGTFTPGPSISSIIVTSGACSAITPTLTVQVVNYCDTSIQCQGGVTLFPNSSFGGPYTYFVDGVAQDSPVVFGLCGGGHTAQVIDGDGNLSDIVSFNIVSTTPSLISYDTCSYSSGSIVNLNNGGNQKWNFQTNLYDKPAACKLSHKITIAYQYTNFDYINTSTSQVNIIPVLPSGTWNLISTATSTQTTLQCGTYNVTTVVYESSNYNVISTPYNLLISNCGFSWTFNNPILTNSGCLNGDIKVRGIVTVKMVSLTSSGNVCCVITPDDYKIGVSPSVEVKWAKVGIPSANVSPTSTSCNPSSPLPPVLLGGL
jgi:hypothetical protein